MRIVIASQNPVKIAAAREAFTTLFPGAHLEMLSAHVDSGVGAQPMSDSATRAGARARASGAMQLCPDADFWVGAEGGIEVIGDQLMAFAWMAVKGTTGEISEARSTTLPLPPAIRRLVDSGMELGEANDKVFATMNSKQGGGAFGLLTRGLHTRETIYTQTLIMALIPFVNRLYPQSSQEAGSGSQPKRN